MKNAIFLVLSMFVSTTVLAESLAPGTIVKSPIAGEIVSVRPLCPVGAVCVTDGTAIELMIEPSSACAKIGFSYAFDASTNTVNVTATEEVDITMMCTAVTPQPHYETISLHLVYPPLVLKFLGTKVSWDVVYF